MVETSHRSSPHTQVPSQHHSHVPMTLNQKRNGQLVGVNSMNKMPIRNTPLLKNPTIGSGLLDPREEADRLDEAMKMRKKSKAVLTPIVTSA
jgi:hypothetical protein